jgi:hypothetical protein
LRFTSRQTGRSLGYSIVGGLLLSQVPTLYTHTVMNSGRTLDPPPHDRRMTMRKFRLIASMVPGVGLLALSAWLPDAHAAVPEVQTPPPGMARVWFLRPSDSANGNVIGAAPVVFANGTPVGPIPWGADFFRDVPAGAYRFTVQPYGLPTGDADTVQLAAGSQTYLQVQWAPVWEEGYPGGEGFDQSHSFFVRTMSPQLAEAYLPSLTYLGQR